MKSSLNYIKIIKRSLSKASGLSESEINLEKPENEEFGDYSTNIALNHHPQSTSHRTPRQVADNLVSKLRSDRTLSKVVEGISVAGPGFINIFLRKDALIDTLFNINSHKDTFGYSDYLKDKKIIFEYGDANTHKLPHIGHLYSYAFGESMSRILKFAGARVRKVCYQGDIGLHVAKCLWAYRKVNPAVPESLEEKVRLLQDLYQEGSMAFDGSEESKKEITDLNKAIYDQNEGIVELWKETRGWSIDYYKGFEEKLNIVYDRYYYESEVYTKGQELVEKNEGGIFKRSEGALIFEGSIEGLHDRVFVTKYGAPTYEAKDLALQSLKAEEWPMDLSIITTANEQDGYFQVIFRALEALYPNLAGKLLHIGFGMINLKTGKMSSRTGDIIGAIDVIDRVSELAKKQNPDPEVAQVVAIGAIKYSFLKNNPKQNIAFDIDESVAKEGNSGPYLQYTYARTQSVLVKSKVQMSKSKKGNNLAFDIGVLNLNDEELSLLRSFIHFSEVVAEAAEKYSPNLICNYIYDLAQKYNSFYNKHRILEEQALGNKSLDRSQKTNNYSSTDLTNLRIALTSATGQIIKTGLDLLGIQTPERM